VRRPRQQRSERFDSLDIIIKAYRATSFPELQAALAAIASDGMNGLANFQGGLSLHYREMIAEFATQHRLPAVYQATMFADAGGLMAWAPDLSEQYRIAAAYVTSRRSISAISFRDLMGIAI
jgi:putative tryptophan/tyrosine transport system substrate-binding protein